MAQLAVFDGDDTLWITEPLYDEARNDARRVVEEAGFSGDQWEALQRVIDVRNVDRLGLSPDRFPTSCVEALEALTDGRESRHGSVGHAIWAAAASVFDRPADVAPFASEMLKDLSQDFDLALLTKGDREVQMRRIQQSGFASMFELIEVVDHKSASTFAAVTAHFDIDPRCAWSIGNSLRSDILPALEVGMNAVLVDAHVWEYERFERHHVPSSVPVLADLSGVASALRSWVAA